MTKLGVAFTSLLPPEQLRPFAQAAEEAGLDQLWVWEDCFSTSGIATATAALGWTERIDVGIALLPVPLRNVALTAMEVATLHRLFPRRFVAGVGHGIQEWMGQVHARVASPLSLLREYVTTLRRLLAGEEVTLDGRYVRLDGVKLDWPPTPEPELLVGAGGPKTLALAAELGDGILLAVALTDDEVAAAADILRHHAPDSPTRQLVVTQIAATGRDAQQRVDRELTFWEKPTDTGLGTAGDAHQIADAVRRLAGLGATTVMIQPTQDEPDLDGFLRFLGAEVRPLLET